MEISSKLIKRYILLYTYKIMLSIFKNNYFKNKVVSYQTKIEQMKPKYLTCKQLAELMAKRADLSIYDIDELSAPLPESVKSSELWGWNDYYGDAYNIKKYAGFPKNYKLKIVVDHAVFIRNNWINDEEYEVKLPAHFVTSNFAKSKIEKKYKDVKLLPIGLNMYYAPDYYTDEQFREEKNRLGKNLLVFPCHSSDCLLVDWKPENFIQEILKVKENGHFDSVTICFYFCEIQRGFHKKFEGYGFNFVTAGHMLDNKFLSRLKTIIKLADVTMSNAIGSHIFYSIGMDKPHYLINEKDIKPQSTYLLNQDSEDTDQIAEGFKHALQDPALMEYEKIFSTYTETLTVEQLKIKDKICGFPSVKSPEEIKQILNETEILYKKTKNKINKCDYIHYFSMPEYANKIMNKEQHE